MSTYPHEQLVHTLSALLIELHALQLLVHSDKQDDVLDLAAVRSSISDVEALAFEALTISRAALEEVPIPELDGVSLSEALSRAVEETAEQLKLASRISFSGDDEEPRSPDRTLSPEAERLLYLLAREALYQVSQHKDARRLRFTFNYRQDDVQMSLEDDGILDGRSEQDAATDTPAPPFDFVPAPADTTLTPVLRDLRSRLEHLGGSLEITLLEERGVRIRALLPYHSSLLPSVSSPVASVAVSDAATDATDQKVTILLVDALAVTRAGLHRLLEAYPGLSVIGEAVDGVQAVSETLELGPQVVLMDTQLPNGQSLEALRQIKQLNLNTRVLLLATQDREEYLYESLRMGADGYVLKDIAPDDLAQAVHMVARGEVLVQPQLAGRLLSRFGRQGRGNAPYETLTTRELEVLRLLARGLRNKEIAARLFVSERTVNFHLANIYQKLGVSGRTEALSKALDQGLVSTS
ncbi:hypothetical protein KDA_19850 [Dictyobacter alpinus]|uniref:DNA-binding response regulator n=1 Tax=Dictyobacter alpinus TaxID=2014873 RepID=A0A402B575_9CHLR|nr:response regulator transcription factor family protein [Dictyobacter alpinus]GCE26501.1 hypothetical protein KDA_19850 [Dictyobacter alpinus]